MSADRDSTKHGPRVDDELAGETESLVRGSPVESRVEEGREKEGPGDEDRDVDARTAPAESLGADEVEARRELSRHLRRSAFPADRDKLLAEARENNAPGSVVGLLSGLPEGARFGTVHEVWAAVRDPSLAQDHERLREDAAGEPLSEADR